MARTPVVRLDNEGNPSDDPVFGHPCIRIGYSFAPAVEEEDGFALPGVSYVHALIDTGSDINAMDEALFGEVESPAQTTVTSFGVTGSSKLTVHEVSFYIPEAKTIHRTGAAKWRPDRTVTRPYQIILGRLFLQSVRFTYDGAGGITALEVFKDPAG